jgi:hypothetical protein
MNHKYLIIIFCLFFGTESFGQILPCDTCAPQGPFFKAKRFDSKAFVGIDANVTQIVKNVGFNLGFSLNWVVNCRFVTSAKYGTLTSTENIKRFVAENDTISTVNLRHNYAGLGFGYIFFDTKRFSLHPELMGGWANAKYDDPITGKPVRKNFGVIIPSVYGIWNATKFFRIGVGINYRATIGGKLNGLKDGNLSGVGGIVFMRVGAF